MPAEDVYLEVRCRTVSGHEVVTSVPKNALAEVVIDRLLEIQEGGSVDFGLAEREPGGKVLSEGEGGEPSVGGRVRADADVIIAAAAAAGASTPTSLSLSDAASTSAPSALTCSPTRLQARLVHVASNFTIVNLDQTLSAQHISSGDELLVVYPGSTSSTPICNREQRSSAQQPKITRAMIVSETAACKAPTRDTTGVTASEPTVGPSLQLLNVFSALHTLGCTLAAALEPPAAPATPGGGDGGDGSGSEAGGGAAVDTEDTDPLKDVDQALVAQLGEMGFPANRAGKALVITGGDFGAALEWLFSHSGDADIDEPLVVPAAGPASPGGTKFQVSVPAFKNLLDMGFSEEQVLAALELAHNNFEVACDLLLGGGDVQAALLKRKDSNLDADSPLLKKLLKDARIHSGLCDPKIRAALASVVKDPQTANWFMNDEDVRPIIVLISQLISER